MGKKKKRDPPQKWESYYESDRFIRIFESMFKSPAFKSLPAIATKIYLILKNEYRGNYTMNRIKCPYSTMEENGISRNSIPPALRILEALGFIERESGALMREATIYHFSDKWKDIKDINTAKEIQKQVRKQIDWEKENRKNIVHSYNDR